MDFRDLTRTGVTHSPPHPTKHSPVPHPTMILISDIDNYDNNNYTNIDSYDDNYNVDIIYDNNDNVCTVRSGVRNPVVLELLVWTKAEFVLQENVQVCTPG